MFLSLQLRTGVLILLLFSVAVVAYSRKRRLTQREAVALAEQFVAQNGYTDLPPDKTKLSYETIEWQRDVERMLQQRHDTLERHAYGILRGRKGGESGWTIVFCYKAHCGSTGRAVTMNFGWQRSAR
jgi:hypothetical protein